MVASPLQATRSQTTLAIGFSRQGVGLHSGLVTTVALRPAPMGTGRIFRRIDLPGQPEIAASLACVNPTQLSTELVQGDAKVRTVEHLLAALAGLGIDNVMIDIDGPEVPLLDGSAQDWAMAIGQAGLAPQDAPRAQPQVVQPFTLQDGDAFVTALPGATTRLTYGIDFPYGAIGNQWHSLELTPASFAAEIAPARTFGFAEQIEQLQAMGLIQGGSLDNALVCKGDDWLNPPLRFANEPARHKLLDLVGDLSLLGSFPRAHILAYKASHRLHTQFAQQLQAQLQA
jgi:UDP-3-O-[3-hydroxymyristoyl] N-acetylglucosamine deacetylase